jgi:hypothetical protein
MRALKPLGNQKEVYNLLGTLAQATAFFYAKKITHKVEALNEDSPLLAA